MSAASVCKEIAGYIDREYPGDTPSDPIGEAVDALYDAKDALAEAEMTFIEAMRALVNAENRLFHLRAERQKGAKFD